jgi:MoaA/NifB/PqqE/SkfB family radical SAM enzyme
VRVVQLTTTATRCRHCHRGEAVAESLATPEKLLEICRELRPVVAIMSGGEPLLCPDLLAIVRTLKAGCAPLRVFVNTNGALLTLPRAHGNVLTSDWVLRGMVRFFANGGSVGRCRAGERMAVVNPDGTLSPCGLLVRSYVSHDELKREFTEKNDCSFCFTSTRGNSERPARHLFLDHLPYLRRRAEA